MKPLRSLMRALTILFIAGVVVYLWIADTGMKFNFSGGVQNVVSDVRDTASRYLTPAATSGSSSQTASESDPDVDSLWGNTGMSGLKVYEYGKSLLPEDQRVCYDRIAGAVLNLQPTVTMPASFEPNVMEKIYKYYAADHPENFYLNNASISYTFVEKSGSRQYQNYTYTFIYTESSADAVAMRAKMGAAAAAMLAAAQSKTTDESRERALHDALVGASRYDTQAAENAKSNPDSFTAYGVFVKNLAVCDGYAKAMKLLLDSAGIQSLYVSGTAKNDEGSGPHAWNMVQVGGKWFYLDATFDDPVYYSSRGVLVDKSSIDHTYFNYKTDSDHTLGSFDASNPFSDTSENYETLPPVG